MVNSLRADYIEREANTPGYALQQAFQRKESQVGPACRSQGIEFVPFPVEVLGGWSKGAVRHLKRLAGALGTRSGKEGVEVQAHLLQKLGLLLQKGNVALLLYRAPVPQGLNTLELN